MRAVPRAVPLTAPVTVSAVLVSNTSSVTNATAGVNLWVAAAVLMQVFDKDLSKGVSVGEVRQTLDSFAAMSGGFGAPEGGGANQMVAWIDVAKRLTPSVFALLDADASKSLSAKELLWFAKVQKAFNSGALRNLTRDVFDTLDASGDSVLNGDELRAAADADSEVLSSAVALVHAAFPLRRDASELKRLLLDVVAAAGAGMADGVALIDADGDGQIDRKEAGRAFKDAKKAFIQATTTLQQMGPMLAMARTARRIEPPAPNPGRLLTRRDARARVQFGGMADDMGPSGRAGGGRGRGSPRGR